MGGEGEEEGGWGGGKEAEATSPKFGWQMPFEVSSYLVLTLEL